LLTVFLRNLQDTGSHEKLMQAIMHVDAWFITVHLISCDVNNRAAYNIIMSSRDTK